MGSWGCTRSWDLREPSGCSEQPKAQMLDWGRGCTEVWGQIHVVQRDSSFAAVAGSYAGQSLQTYEVNVCKELWRLKSWGLRFPWRASLFFFSFKQSFEKVPYLVENIKCYLSTQSSRQLYTETRTTHTDVRWIPYHLFLFWYWPKYFCSKEKITQKLPTKNYASGKVESWFTKLSREKHVPFVKRDNSQILCPLSAFKSILSCLGLLKSRIYVVITDNILPEFTGTASSIYF